MRLTTLLVLASLAARPAMAGIELNLTANSPARVILDGEEVGQTPFSARDVAPGFHQVRVQSMASGETRIYDVYSPASAVLRKDVDVRFEGVPEEAVAAEAPPVTPEAQAAADEEAAYQAGREREKERQKVRTRNTLLGVAAANELINKGKSKKTVRGLSLGGALLNELLKR